MINGGVLPLWGHIIRKGHFQIAHYFGDSEMTQVKIIAKNNSGHRSIILSQLV